MNEGIGWLFIFLIVIALTNALQSYHINELETRIEALEQCQSP